MIDRLVATSTVISTSTISIATSTKIIKIIPKKSVEIKIAIPVKKAEVVSTTSVVITTETISTATAGVNTSGSNLTSGEIAMLASSTTIVTPQESVATSTWNHDRSTWQFSGGVNFEQNGPRSYKAIAELSAYNNTTYWWIQRNSDGINCSGQWLDLTDKKLAPNADLTRDILTINAYEPTICYRLAMKDGTRIYYGSELTAHIQPIQPNN